MAVDVYNPFRACYMTLNHSLTGMNLSTALFFFLQRLMFIMLLGTFSTHLDIAEAWIFTGPRFCGHGEGMKTQKKRTTTAFLLPLCQFDNYSSFKLPSQWKGKLVNVLTRWIWSGESQKQLRNNSLGHHISPLIKTIPLPDKMASPRERFKSN